MKEWIEPVVDRTKEDVEKASRLFVSGWGAMNDSEKRVWISGLKGALNTSDLERISNNVQVLADKLHLELENVYEHVPVFLTEAYFLNLGENVKRIRDLKIAHDDTPYLPKAPYNTYEKINNIEKILKDAYDILSDNFNYFAGTEIYSGDTIGFLL